MLREPETEGRHTWSHFISQEEAEGKKQVPPPGCLHGRRAPSRSGLPVPGGEQGSRYSEWGPCLGPGYPWWFSELTRGASFLRAGVKYEKEYMPSNRKGNITCTDNLICAWFKSFMYVIYTFIYMKLFNLNTHLRQILTSSQCYRGGSLGKEC